MHPDNSQLGLAIDVVLLPPTAVMERAVALNRELMQEFEPRIVLDKDNCLPHISLLMGRIAVSQLDTISKSLDEVASFTPALPLTITAQYIEDVPGGVVTGWTVERTPDIEQLHESLMSGLGPICKQPATVGDMYSPPEPGEFNLAWINNFQANSSHDRFAPHITIGWGRAKRELPQPTSFGASRLAICHLGNYCTCRKILYEVPLL